MLVENDVIPIAQPNPEEIKPIESYGFPKELNEFFSANGIDKIDEDTADKVFADVDHIWGKLVPGKKIPKMSATVHDPTRISTDTTKDSKIPQDLQDPTKCNYWAKITFTYPFGETTIASLKKIVVDIRSRTGSNAGRYMRDYIRIGIPTKLFEVLVKFIVEGEGTFQKMVKLKPYNEKNGYSGWMCLCRKDFR